MALKIPYQITCSCGKRFKESIYEYVFTEYDEELKNSLLSGEFNIVTCPSCKTAIHIENRFLYRDEKNRLWVWVCKKREEDKRKRLEKVLFARNPPMEAHFLDHQAEYKRFLVFGREGLIELLLREDKALKRKEEKHLKENPAVLFLTGNRREPGYLFLCGEKIKVSLPLNFLRLHADPVSTKDMGEKWLKYYAGGANIHNRFSSLLPSPMKQKWRKIREKEPIEELPDEYDDFAGSYATYRLKSKNLKEEYPERYYFFGLLKKASFPRKVVSYRR
jgi:hypothetical protein